jgi:hypothetical protein
MQSPSHSANSHISPEQDKAIAAFAANLEGFAEKLDEEQVCLDNPELAFHQLEALSVFTWGGIDPLVRFYVPRFLPNGPQMHPDHLEECLQIACDEYVVRGHRLIMRRYHAGKTASLNDLAKEVYNPKRPEFGDFRKRLRDNVLFRMKDIGIWDYVEGERRKSKSGNEYHPGYAITAGPVLIAFDRYMYIPWALRHGKVRRQLLAQMEN